MSPLYGRQQLCGHGLPYLHQTQAREKPTQLSPRGGTEPVTGGRPGQTVLRGQREVARTG